MNKTAGKVLGTGVGGALGLAMNTLDKNNKGSTYPEFALKGLMAYALYSYANEREEQILENCALGYMAYETMRLTKIGRQKTEEKAEEQLKGTPTTAIVTQEQASKYSQPEFLQGVGSALKGLSSVLTAFKGPE